MKLEFAEYFYDDDGSFNLDGTLIRQAKLTAKQIYEWGNELCPHFNSHGLHSYSVISSIKRGCDKCWNKLLEDSK